MRQRREIPFAGWEAAHIVLGKCMAVGPPLPPSPMLRAHRMRLLGRGVAPWGWRGVCSRQRRLGAPRRTYVAHVRNVEGVMEARRVIMLAPPPCSPTPRGVACACSAGDGHTLHLLAAGCPSQPRATCRRVRHLPAIPTAAPQTPPTRPTAAHQVSKRYVHRPRETAQPRGGRARRVSHPPRRRPNGRNRRRRKVRARLCKPRGWRRACRRACLQSGGGLGGGTCAGRARDGRARAGAHEIARGGADFLCPDRGARWRGRAS